VPSVDVTPEVPLWPDGCSGLGSCSTRAPPAAPRARSEEHVWYHRCCASSTSRRN